jgi:4-alpha-glucanotransferase
MSFPRASGILLHPTSLPGRFGIGDLGPEAYRFVDFLAAAGQKIWQVLPLTPTGYGDSPYQALSSSAGNPLLISPELLLRDGYLDEADLSGAPSSPPDRIDYGAVIAFKRPLLQRAFRNFESRAPIADREAFRSFCTRSGASLEDYALFMALKDAHGGAAWTRWPHDIAQRQPTALRRWTGRLRAEIAERKFEQFLFARQWLALKRYCQDRGIRILGDLPIYVAHDSDEVWAHPDLFRLDSDGNPLVVAGVPPDYFSATGQLWGNPIYRWDRLAEDGYRWWIERFRVTLTLVDMIRLDHFRGFEAYWEVPASEPTAVNGRWVQGPGAALFEAVEKALGRLPIVAENLGFITPEVEALRKRFGFPGMSILQFAFGTDPQARTFRPHTYPRNLVAYTGTHDNDTTVGWWTSRGTGDSTRSAEEVRREREFARRYLGAEKAGPGELHWVFIRALLASVADTVIVPLQDVLGLGSEARMNQPATWGNNWRWRYKAEMLTEEVQERLREMTVLYDR